MTQIDALNIYIVVATYFILIALAYVVYNYVKLVINERNTKKDYYGNK